MSLFTGLSASVCVSESPRRRSSCRVDMATEL